MEQFIVKSSVSEAQLVFNRRVGEDFVVEFQSNHLRIVQPVCGFIDPQGVSRLFLDAAAHPKPWSGELLYQSLEQEFAMSASCDALGHVQLTITFARLGAEEEWSAIASVQIELGQLSQLAANARHFFGANVR